MEDLAAVRQNLILESRNRLTVTGTQEILRLDPESVAVKTALGELTIRGEALRVDALLKDKGELYLTGRISSLAYASETARTTWRERLFG